MFVSWCDRFAYSPDALQHEKPWAFTNQRKETSSWTRYCLPVRLQKLPASKQCFFFPGLGNMWKTCAMAFVRTPCWSFRAWAHLWSGILLHGQRLDLEGTFWRHWVGTVGILAQGTHWTLTVRHVFLQNCPRFDSSRAHACVMMWQICLFPMPCNMKSLELSPTRERKRAAEKDTASL